MLGSYLPVRPGASLRTNYSINIGRSLVGLHCFHATACVDTMQVYGRIIHFVVIAAAGDAMRGLSYLFAGGACPLRHAV